MSCHNSAGSAARTWWETNWKQERPLKGAWAEQEQEIKGQKVLNWQGRQNQAVGRCSTYIFGIVYLNWHKIIRFISIFLAMLCHSLKCVVMFDHKWLLICLLIWDELTTDQDWSVQSKSSNLLIKSSLESVSNDTLVYIFNLVWFSCWPFHEEARQACCMLPSSNYQHSQWRDQTPFRWILSNSSHSTSAR